MTKFIRDMKKVSKACSAVLTSIYGPDWDLDPNFKDTPDRMAKAYGELLQYEQDDRRNEAINSIFEKIFPSKTCNMVFAPNIHVFSMCPHHLLPVRYNITIGYIPQWFRAKDRKVLGASKLYRLAEVLAKRAILQEDLGAEIVQTLESYLSPQGVACVISGIHDCMTVRGIKNDGSFETSEMTGAFKDNDSTRSEFFSLLSNATRRSL